jgi:molecular chaperone HtpG
MTIAVSAENLTRLAGRTRERLERQAALDPVIGKDILELLSSSMYVDPRAIYREYVQNAADAIDEAYRLNLLSGDNAGKIEIAVEQSSRSITIRDNGCGIASADAERVLTSLGASAKRGSNARGFRGVGRLAAFGYAQSVSFKAKAAGETHSTEIRWDCRKLKTALTNPTYSGDLRQIVRDVVTIVSEREPDKASHYFEVRLERVVRIKNDILLDAEDIEAYLGEVAPAPFRGDFHQADRILTALANHVPACNFLIHVNGGSRHVTRPHKSDFNVAKGKFDRIRELDFHVLDDEDGKPLAVIWLAHHGFLGALHGAPEMRGLRARVGDMQIGDDQIFMTYFPESRFNSWTIGEIHVLDRRIIPNGRRDGFEQNEQYTDLVTRLVPILRGVGAQCRATSAARERVRRFESGVGRVRELFAVLKSRDLTPRKGTLSRNEIADIFEELSKVTAYAGLLDEDQQKLKRRLSALKSDYSSLKANPKPSQRFAKLPKSRRLAYEEAVDVLYDLVPRTSAGSALIDKMIERLERRSPKAKTGSKKHL